MLKRKGRRLAALLSALVCMSAVAIPASAKVCESKSNSAGFNAYTEYAGIYIRGTISNGSYSSSLSAKIQGNFRYANDKDTYSFKASSSGVGYSKVAKYTAKKVVNSATGYGDFNGSGPSGSMSVTLHFD